MKNSGFSTGKRYILQNRHFQDKCEKSSKKPAKILPKSTPNPSNIGKKSINIDQKSDADLRCAKKSEKNVKKCEKVTQDPPKRSDIKTSTGYAKPPQKGAKPLPREV